MPTITIILYIFSGLRHLPHKLERPSAALALAGKSDLWLVEHGRAGALARLLDGDAGGVIVI